MDLGALCFRSKSLSYRLSLRAQSLVAVICHIKVQSYVGLDVHCRQINNSYRVGVKIHVVEKGETPFFTLEVDWTRVAKLRSESTSPPRRQSVGRVSRRKGEY
jgi:hypothetical protein